MNDKVYKLLENINKDHKLILEDYNKGNEKAKDLVVYYDMWYKIPNDMMAFTLAEIYYNEWKEERKKERGNSNGDKTS